MKKQLSLFEIEETKEVIKPKNFLYKPIKETPQQFKTNKGVNVLIHFKRRHVIDLGWVGRFYLDDLIFDRISVC